MPGVLTSRNFRHLDRYVVSDPRERCGIIFRSGGVITFVEVPNGHPDSGNHFRILMADLHNAKMSMDLVYTAGQPYRVVGYFHTHPGEDVGDHNPSKFDVDQAKLTPGLVHAMYRPLTRKLVWFDGSGIIHVDNIAEVEDGVGKRQGRRSYGLDRVRRRAE